MSKTSNSKESTMTADVKNEAEEFAVLSAECDPSLERSFVEKLREAGFKHKTDALITLVRDFIAGRIKYKQGILQNQANSLN